MSIDDNVDVIGSSLQNIKNAIEAKGVTPSGNITTYAAAIGQIQGSTPVEIDGVTITKNTNNELQTVGVINDNSGNAVKVWVGTQAEFDAITTKDPSTMYYITDQEEEPVQSERNVGEIVMSTIPLTDAGLHLLDGALLNGGGIYKNFVDYIADLYEDNTLYYWSNTAATPFAIYTKSITPQIGDTVYNYYGEAIGIVTDVNSSGRPGYNGFYYKEPSEDTNPRGIFVTEADWQTSVTTYGVCGKFVYDSGNYYAWYSSTTEITYYTTSENPQIGDTIFEKSDNTFVESIETVVSVSPTNSYIQVVVDGDRYKRQISSDEALPTVRLPKVTGILEGTTDVTALGDLVEAGLPNLKGYLRGVGSSNIGNDGFSDGTLFSGPNGQYYTRDGGPNPTGAISHFDASNYNSIYGNSTTVQPQTIKCYYYIVIATSTKTDIEVDIDTIATDLNGKADTDLTNLNNNGKIAIAHNAMPSAVYDDLTVGASGTIYIAPADGYFYIEALATGGATTNNSLTLSSNSINLYAVFGGKTQGSVLMPVKKDDSCTLSYQNDTIMNFRFYYAKGSESEA